MSILNEVLNPRFSSGNVRTKTKFVVSQGSSFPSRIPSNLDSAADKSMKSNLKGSFTNVISTQKPYPKPAGNTFDITVNMPVSIRKNPPSFYQKLNSYFPSCEMKKMEHFIMLLRDKSHIYKIQETNEYVVVYSVIGEYLFVDYIWVSQASRGNGLGGKIIRDLKKHNKVIILEVEQIDKLVVEKLKMGKSNDLTLQEQSDEYKQKVDAVKRLKFYKREGFYHANRVSYVRKAALTGEESSMEILYWDPRKSQITQHEVLLAMRLFYDEIHKYMDFELYGKEFEDSAMVLQFRPPTEDMLSSL